MRNVKNQIVWFKYIYILCERLIKSDGIGIGSSNFKLFIHKHYALILLLSKWTFYTANLWKWLTSKQLMNYTSSTTWHLFHWSLHIVYLTCDNIIMPKYWHGFYSYFQKIIYLLTCSIGKLIHYVNFRSHIHRKRRQEYWYNCCRLVIRLKTNYCLVGQLTMITHVNEIYLRY